VVPGVTDRRFKGKITYFTAGSDYGFIHCPELFERYRKDVFVSAEFIGARGVGDPVSFNVIFKKQGSPQAISLQDLEAAAPTNETAGAAAAPGSEAAAVAAFAEAADEWELARFGYVIRTVGESGDGITYPQCGDRICISYCGRLAVNGAPFDEDDECYFTVGQGSMIAGLDMGLTEMSLGEEAQLLIHETHGYGKVGAPAPVPIPPGANLVFHVKLLNVEKMQEEKVERQEATSSAPENEVVELRRKVENLSVGAWLREVDKSGVLAVYEKYLSREFESVDEIVLVYTKVGRDGNLRLEKEFFKDVGVTRLPHQRLFRNWFEA